MKICFIYSNRAEYSLLTPFIKYFKKKIITKEINLNKKIEKINLDKNLSNIYSFCYKNFKKNKYDYVCVLGDRRELSFIAIAALHTDTKLIHIAAGEYVHGIHTYDQYIRPIVSILSKIQICFSYQAKIEVKKLFKGISNLNENTFVLGNPVFSGINIDEIKCNIKEKYDIILLHPNSLSIEETKKDVLEVEKKLKNKKTIFIYGNKDKNYNIIKNFYAKLNNKKYIFFESLPKRKYFGLVKYCDKFYTNSSSITEIKFLNKKCLHQIGLRNKCRSESLLDTESPKHLLEIVKKELKK